MEFGEPQDGTDGSGAPKEIGAEIGGQENDSRQTEPNETEPKQTEEAPACRPPASLNIGQRAFMGVDGNRLRRGDIVQIVQITDGRRAPSRRALVVVAEATKRGEVKQS